MNPLVVAVLRGWSDRTTLLLLLFVLIVCGQPGAGEMRKSWQAKSVDVQVQLLKAARTIEESPGAKPPETIVPSTEEPAGRSDSTGSEATTGVVTPGDEPLGVAKLSTQFSSRVRSKNGSLSPTTGPVKVSDPDPEPADRSVPLHLEHQMEEIQVDDATVQDDDEEEDDDDDDEDTLGWDGTGGKDKQPEHDLIDNILEEVNERMNQPTDDSQEAKETSKDSIVDGKVKKYTFPPVLNMTIDEPNSIVKVKLNHDIVRDMINTGRSGGGGIGGKKMLRYVIPLFILPFLIQSAVIPFMLTAVKLFLLKSLMAGKVAIFLLLLGAFKNFTKKERDVYVKDVPDRRYEPSSEGFAYLAEGRPSNWVN
ncbi:uncharacterized protein LOC126575143 [Anopheles aquasalis]|uniref:uncharacterized protein LOC126575143 n=1 Tax=Anopheles aquasalis TaxID=42839 RepID=UPI00215AB165|nr:uncharacterized protein LOC126575143 [Anopheles aquasalis]